MRKPIKKHEKIILVLLDGLGDRSYPILGNRTPLQAAHTPNLDLLSRLGSNGMFHAAAIGQCLPSELAHYFLFGYDPKNFPGRGLLEAVGAGVDFNDQDVLVLAHLCEVDYTKDFLPLLHGTKDIKGEPGEIEQLFSDITPYESKGVQFRLLKTGRNNGILVMSGPVSPWISDSDPMTIGHAMAQVLPIQGNPEPDRARLTADALNNYLAYCHKILRYHPINQTRVKNGMPEANFLATQRCGRRIVQEKFSEKWGLNGMLIASGQMYAGLALELGFTLVRTDDSPDPEADLRGRINLALNDTSHDFIHVHTKVPDEAAHMGDPMIKLAAIESLDRGLDELVDSIGKNNELLLAVTGDHSTPSLSDLIHSGETVPVIICGRQVRRDTVTVFDEINAARGCLGLLRGNELMLTLLNYSDRSIMMGHRMGKKETCYFPRDYETFKL